MSARTLGTLTIVQAPRADVVPIIDRHVPPAVRRIHRGVLDGLSRAEIADRYEADPDEAALITRLHDGTAINLSRRRMRDGVQTALTGLEAEGCDVILLLCTGTFVGLGCRRAWLIEPDHIIPAMVAGLIERRQLGIIVPIAGHGILRGKDSMLDNRSAWWLEIYARRKPGRRDPLLQIIGERTLLHRDLADDDRSEIRIARQQPAHRIDENICALLCAHPAEAADGVAARQSGLSEGRGAIRRRRIAIGIDAMRDDSRFTLEIGSRDVGGCDDRIHLPDQPARDPGVVALRRRSKYQFQRPAERAQQHAYDHLVVAPRVPDQRRAPAP